MWGWELTEWVDLSRDETLVRLTERDEDMGIGGELDQVLWVLSPHPVGLLGVLERSATGVSLGPSSLELESRVLVTELDRVEQVVIDLAR